MNSKQAKTVTPPKLRFKQFGGDWELVKLKDISVPVTEKVGKRKLTPVSISAGIGFVPQAEKFGRDISGNQYELYTLVRDGEFVFNKGNSKTFPEGCVYLLEGWGEVAAPNVFISFRLKKGYVNRFFQYVFEKNTHGRELRPHITSGARSNGLLNISKETFFNIDLPVTSEAEQAHIAAALMSLDALITAEAAQLEALRQHKQGLMQQLFPAEGERVPRVRFKEFEDSGEWEEKKLGELAIAVNERAKSIDEKSVLTLSSEYGLIRQGDYFGRKIAGEATERYIKIKLGDFVYNDRVTKDSEYGTFKRLIKYDSGIVSPIYKCFRLSDSNNSQFWQYYFESGSHNLSLKQFVNEGAREGRFNISTAKLLSITINTPTLPEQNRIAAVLSSLDELITTQAAKVDTLRQFKRGLMQGLFPGVDG